MRTFIKHLQILKTADLVQGFIAVSTMHSEGGGAFALEFKAWHNPVGDNTCPVLSMR